LSPEIVLETYLIKNGIRRSAKLVGVEPNYFELISISIGSREKCLMSSSSIKGAPVCIIGKSIQTKFFPTENPLGKTIKCGPNWLTSYWSAGRENYI
jgi:putative ABC transport system permease protein